MLPKARVARFSKIVRKDSAVVTDETLITAPGVGRKIVIDLLYFNISVAGSVEIKEATGAMVDDGGVCGGNFGANGGFINLTNIELADNAPLIWSTTGTTPVTFLTVTYHIEQGD